MAGKMVIMKATLAMLVVVSVVAATSVLTVDAAERTFHDSLKKATTTACCDKCLCTKSIPPQCRCDDQNRSCHSGCKMCRCTRSMPPTCRCMDITNSCYPQCSSPSPTTAQAEVIGN